MAVTAVRKLFMDTGRVRSTVAISTLGYHFVLFGMTGNAGNILMFIGAGHQQLISGLMAGSTMGIGSVLTVSDGRRHVRLVTDAAVGLGLLGRMR